MEEAGMGAAAAHEQVPGTPGIREVMRSGTDGSDSLGFCEVGGATTCGIRKVGLRAEIDTSPPFGSVKEAVHRFGGSESWPPLYKLAEYNGAEEFDIKKVEEQAAELEKDLIVKELETLDVLEELGTTKKIVEELKLQLQKEALKCVASATPEIKEMNTEHQITDQQQQIMAGSSSPCPVTASSPDLILMELKQAKLNLGRTINDLGVIQNSVESLNKRMKKEKSLLERTRERLTSKFITPGPTTLREELKQVRDQQKPQKIQDHNGDVVSQGEQLKKLAEISKAMLVNEQSNYKNSQAYIKTAEMRWVAAKKMEEAAKAAEALALAEIKALSSFHENKPSAFLLPEPEGPFSGCPLFSRTRNSEEAGGVSKVGIMRMMEEAVAEVKHSKRALEEALHRVDIANKKQLAAGDALHRWAVAPAPQPVYSPTRFKIIHPVTDHQFHPQNSPLMSKQELASDDQEHHPKPVLRPTVSMRDVLSRKQVLLPPEESCVVRRQADHHGRQKVALSQMLQELREDLTAFPKKTETNTVDCDDDRHPHQHQHQHQQKQFFAQRRKFGFIHISLPLTKKEKKKNHPL